MKPAVTMLIGLAGLAWACGAWAGDYGYKPPKPVQTWTPYGDTTRRRSEDSFYRPPASYPRATDAFHPWKGQHVDSPRGGINAHPSAPKPKGYIGFD